MKVPLDKPKVMAKSAMISKSSGLTLVELMIVVSVLAILAAIALPRYSSARDEAAVSSTATIIKTVASALQQYYIEHGEWPPDVNPRIKPPELEPYLPTMNFADTPIGGGWDYDNGLPGTATTDSGTPIGISVTVWDGDEDLYIEIDRLIDDGDLSTGQVQYKSTFAPRLMYLVKVR